MSKIMGPFFAGKNIKWNDASRVNIDISFDRTYLLIH